MNPDPWTVALYFGIGWVFLGMGAFEYGRKDKTLPVSVAVVLLVAWPLVLLGIGCGWRRRVGRDT